MGVVATQWDIRTGAIVQEYQYHLAPVNTVTFADDGRRFVSTSVSAKGMRGVGARRELCTPPRLCALHC